MYYTTLYYTTLYYTTLYYTTLYYTTLYYTMLYYILHTTRCTTLGQASGPLIQVTVQAPNILLI